MRSRGRLPAQVRVAGRVLAPLIAALALALFAVPGRASTATQGTRSQPLPCSDRLCRAPCVIIPGFFDCESKNPRVTLDALFDGAGCMYTGTIDWGDGTIDPYTYAEPGPVPQNANALPLKHTYRATGVYHAVLTADETPTPPNPGLGGISLCGSDHLRLGYDIAILAGHYDLVALGDSYSAGVGAGQYAASNNTCDRSANAWPRLLTHYTTRVRRVLLLACSGATSEDMLGTSDRAGQPNQLATLRAVNTQLVTLTIGGDDIGFSDVLTQCFLDVRYDCVANGRLARLKTDIKNEQDRLVHDYVAVADAAPRARILVIDYPQIFPGLGANQCHWLTDNAKENERLTLLAAADIELDGAIFNAVSLANRALQKHGAYDRIEEIGVDHVLAGHELCTANAWMYPLNVQTAIATVFGQRYPGHPTLPGQQAIARAVGRYIGKNL